MLWHANNHSKRPMTLRLLLIGAVASTTMLTPLQPVWAQIRPSPLLGEPPAGTIPNLGGGLLNPPPATDLGGSPQFLNQGIDPSQQQIGGAAEQQLLGNFPAINRSGTLPIGTIQNSWNDPMAAQGQISPGVMRFVWRPDFVMPIRTREFMTTTVELPPWENITEIIVGDTTIFEAARVKSNVFALRPRYPGADTNLTAIGSSGNIYSFYVRSETWNSQSITDLAVFVTTLQQTVGGIQQSVPRATFTPQGAVASPATAPFGLGGAPAPASGSPALGVPNNGNFSPGGRVQPPDYLRQIMFNPENLSFNMRIFARSPGDAEIAPIRAFSDGIWTYFDYGERADTVQRPVVFRVIDGVDSMVNTRTAGPNGNLLIAEAVGNFTLRNGNKVVCIYQTDRPPHFTNSSPSVFFQTNDGDVGTLRSGAPAQFLSPYGNVHPRDTSALEYIEPSLPWYMRLF